MSAAGSLQRLRNGSAACATAPLPSPFAPEPGPSVRAAPAPSAHDTRGLGCVTVRGAPG